MVAAKGRRVAAKIIQMANDMTDSLSDLSPDATEPALWHRRPRWASFARLGSAVARSLLDTLLPTRCLRCGGITEGDGALCAGCWGKIGFIAPPMCACCGQPFDIDPGAGALCAHCLDHPPSFGRARAVFRYDGDSRALVLRFKHGDRIGAATHFARWMARAGSELLAESDLIVPVPLHRWRLLHRRYNQAALLALALSRLSGISCAPDALTRARSTPSQGQMGRKARRANVRGAFRLARPVEVAGKRVLLVDDVLTSGATAGECAETLIRGGAEKVDLLTLSRVTMSGA